MIGKKKPVNKETDLRLEQKNLLDIWASLPEHKRELALAYLSGLMQSSR